MSTPGGITHLDPDYPWERQAGEPEAAWRAFQHYRDQPLGQSSYGNTAQWMLDQGHQKGKYRTVVHNVEQWASRWDWVERRATWMKEQDRRRRETFQQVQDEANRRNSVTTAAAIRLGAEIINSALWQLANKESELSQYLASLPPKERLAEAYKWSKAMPGLMAADSYVRGLLPDANPAQLGVEAPGVATTRMTDIERGRKVAALLDQIGAMNP